MKVKVNRRLCSGHALCQAACPEVYGSDEFGYCVIENAVVPSELEDKALDGLRRCPEGAIVLEQE